MAYDDSDGSCGGPEVHKLSGIYYVWIQCSRNSFRPTDIYRFQSSDLKTFIRSPVGIVMGRTTKDEGMNVSGGQVADASMIEVDGKTYMFYDATDTQNPNPTQDMHLKLAIATMSMDQLVKTSEGTRNTDSLDDVPTTATK